MSPRHRVGAAPVTATPTRDAALVETLLGAALTRDDRRRADEISEAELAGQIRDLRDHLAPGILLAHFRPARTAHGWATPVEFDGAGFPDLVIVDPAARTVMFRELKSRHGVLTDTQHRWLDRLTAAGADAAVWRPSDMPTIVDVLSHGKGQLQ